MNGRYESILLSDEDLQALLEDAYRRRNGQLHIGSSSVH
jgi:hypothetical protein